MHKYEFDVLIIGGGAAGFFGAINIAEMNPNLRIAILERSSKVLSKVKVSGGGRCNVTHAEFDPMELVRNYPRGEKEMLGPFHKFMTGDVVSWFEDRGVQLKIESDGRMFPVTDNSQTIIDCFFHQAGMLGIQVLTKNTVTDIHQDDRSWRIGTSSGTYSAGKLLVTAGSSASVWKMIEKLGHTIVSPVPSLFTFNINDERIKELPGVSTNVKVQVLDLKENSVLDCKGPLLITHWGMSGPAILKLSAWGARVLETDNYKFKIEVNWLEDLTMEEVTEYLNSKKQSAGRQTVFKSAEYGVPKRLWYKLVEAAGISSEENWGDLSKIQIRQLAGQLTKCRFEVKGKNTYKEEFVTAGGVELTEVHFKTFESKLYPNLHFAGEVLNIDAVTGGFNFQSAWTGAFLAAKAISGM